MNPPDLKPGMNPNPNLNFYDENGGFTAGTDERGNWISPMTLVLSIPPSSTIPTRNRPPRSHWSSLIPPVEPSRWRTRALVLPTIKFNPMSPVPLDSTIESHRVPDSAGVCVERDHRGSGCFRNRGSGSLCIERVQTAAPFRAVTVFLCRWRCWSAPQPPTLGPLAPATN